MKHMRKALSLFLVLAMVVCFAVPAFAASPEGATVTVYITRNMFTKGGIDESGNQVLQEYKSNTAFPDDTKVFTLNIDSITDKELKNCRDIYKNPDTTSTTVNVLDAIACVLSRNGYTLTGGWDTWNKPNGGYISSVSGYTGTSGSEEVEVNDTLYTKYYGYGWNIAFNPGDGFVVPTYYGNNYDVVNNMVIVFDFSYYELYYAA